MREGFRHFRTDRISKVQVVDKRYPRRRQALLKEWRAAEGIPERETSDPEFTTDNFWQCHRLD